MEREKGRRNMAQTLGRTIKENPVPAAILGFGLAWIASEAVRKARPEMMRGIEVNRAITIDKPAMDIYNYWRQLENLPRIIDHLESVQRLSDRRSHWVANTPMGRIEWDAEVMDDEPGRRITWRSIGGSQLTTSGSVEFRDAPGGRGTEVRASFRYEPPGGKLAAIFAKLFRTEPSQEIAEALRRLKRMMETGEPTVYGSLRYRSWQKEPGEPAPYGPLRHRSPGK